MKKNLLITGGAGFVGANLAVFLAKRLKDHKVICFDNLSRPGSNLNLARLRAAGIKFVRGDVRQKKALLKLPKIDALIDCCAEPSVLAGFNDPDHMIETNLVGTINCLELARRDSADFIFLSTSRVYPIAGVNDIPFQELRTRFDWRHEAEGAGHSYQGIAENFPLTGARSLYGATKLCSEHLIHEFMDMYSLKGVINRLGVIAGPWQMGKIDQGVIGFWIVQHMFGRPLSYIGFGGEGKQVRDVIHIDDVCDLVLYQLQNMSAVTGEIFNAGGGRGNTVSLQELTNLVQKITGKSVPVQSVVEQRKADVRIYITDNSYVNEKIGWSPKRNMENIVVDTHKWIKRYSPVLKKIL